MNYKTQIKRKIFIGNIWWETPLGPPNETYQCVFYP